MAHFRASELEKIEITKNEKDEPQELRMFFANENDGPSLVVTISVGMFESMVNLIQNVLNDVKLLEK